MELFSFAAVEYLVAREWSKYAKENACAVDWSRMAYVDYSVMVDKNIKLVAAEMVAFVEAIPNFEPENIVEHISVAGQWPQCGVSHCRSLRPKNKSKIQTTNKNHIL